MCAHTHTNTHIYSCGPFGSQEREFTENSHWDARVDRHHLIVWHFNFSPQLCLPESRFFLFFPSLFPFYPQSLFLTLLFSAGLEEQSQSRQSLHFVTLLRVGLSLTPWHICCEIVFVHQSDLPVLLSLGEVVHYNMGPLISISVCLLFPCSSVPQSFSCSFFLPLSLTVLLYLSLSLSFWHLLYLFFSCLLAILLTLSLFLFIHSVFIWVVFSSGLVVLVECWHTGAQLECRREHSLCAFVRRCVFVT